MSGPTPMKATRGLPERWLYCPKMGKMIMNKFIPFKTPLCNLYDDQIPEKRLRFHPSDALNHENLDGRRIALWIDLTKTDRYYYVDEVEKAGCKYKKLSLAGHNATPTVDETARFVTIVKEFFNKSEDGVVGIHCTHGFNRTGFLICAFLYQEEGWGLDAAIGTFKQSRPSGIYKQDYIDELFERYRDDPDEEVIQAPPKPTWEDGDPTTQIPAVNNSESHSQASTSAHQNTNAKKFMDGRVPGVFLCEDQTKKQMLRGKIQAMCSAKKQNFPGLQPVSLSHKNITMLSQEPYKVSWKADGMRYMVLILGKNEVYAFDRDNEVFEITNLHFPNNDGGHISNTLVDAEMIIDMVEQDKTKIERPRLLIYDIIQFQSHNMVNKNFDERQNCIRHQIIKARDEALKKRSIPAQPISVRLKEFWLLEAVPKLFEPKFTRNVGHEIDGLIFQPVEKPYVTGRCDSVLKWKPPSHNSVDFRLKIAKESREGFLPEYKGYLFVLGSQVPFGMMKATRELKQYDNKIIECTLELDAHGKPKEWKLMRERTDKSEPNAITTAESVMGTMLNPITKEDLCRYIERHKFCEEPQAKRPKEQ